MTHGKPIPKIQNNPSVNLPVNQPVNPEFLTIDQAAVVFQVRRATVRLWLRRKLLRGVKIGRDWRIAREAIEEFKR